MLLLASVISLRFAPCHAEMYKKLDCHDLRHAQDEGLFSIGNLAIKLLLKILYEESGNGACRIARGELDIEADRSEQIRAL